MNEFVLRKKKIRMSDIILTFTIYMSALTTVVLLLGIMGYVFAKGIFVITPTFLTTVTSSLHKTVGIAGNIVNTLYIIVLTLLMATPIGIGCAIYLSEYAKPGKLVSIIEFTTETLAGIPSIIFGLFGMVFFGNTLKNITMDIKERKVTALIGPSGCGKSTFLKSINRMTDLIPSVRVEGSLTLDGEDIYHKDVEETILRKKIGMVFQQPNPFPMSIYDNVAYGPRIHGIKNRVVLDEIVEKSLIKAAIFDEVKDRMKKSALSLSGGQQQRLCIARALAVEPEVILMDEPTSALDPISTLKIEELMDELRDQYSVVVVTHNMQQAARVSDDTAFFLLGELIEFGATEDVFSRPREKKTEDYITGRFG